MIYYARQLKAGRLNPYGFLRIVKNEKEGENSSRLGMD